MIPATALEPPTRVTSSSELFVSVMNDPVIALPVSSLTGDIGSTARTTGSVRAIAACSSLLEHADKANTTTNAANAAANFLNFIISSFVNT